MRETGIDEKRFPFTRISNVALAAAVAFAFLAIERFATFHNETYDLAFYARLVWGLGRLDHHQPLTSSHFFGLHASPILYVLGGLGRVFPIIPLMLVTQAASVAAAGIPLARIAARRAGHPFAADVTLLAYLLHPAISTLATYEFHPSALALLPLAVALDCFDVRQVKRGVIALLFAVACREDVALIAACMGLALALRREHRRAGLLVFASGVAYFALYLFVIAPRYLPVHGSMQLHFAQLGGSPAGVARSLFLHPIATLAMVITPAKLLYAARMLVPVAFLSLLAPRWLLPAIVPFAINFLSAFPTAVQIQSHYAVLAVPFVLASAAHGVGRLAANTRGNVDRALALAALAVALGTLHMQRRAGALPFTRRWDASAYHADTRSAEAAEIVRRIPPGASVAAPDYILPHVASRSLIERVPGTRAEQYIVLSAGYRSRFGQTQDLWRSTEEILVRNTLASSRYGLYVVVGQHLLFRRGWSPRAHARDRYIDFQPAAGVHQDHIDVGPSLSIAGWSVRAIQGGSVLSVLFVAKRPLPHDVGFEVGYGAMHPASDREDPAHIVAALPFDGLFSPVHLRVGEVARTEMALSATPEQLAAAGLYFGARRLDGSRLDADSAHWTPLRIAPSSRTP